ncbi:NAD(P)/FAD-dependent oxidoreductase [Leucobacter sp. HY1910]
MRYDHIIVGGGVHGCAAAYYLAKGGTSVLLLERHTLASGASGGVGLRGVRANGRDIRELPLMRRAYEIWPELNDELGLDEGYRRVGGIELLGAETFEEQSRLDAVRTRVAIQCAFGIPTELLDREALDELEPGAAESVAGAIYCALDGTAEHNEVTRGFARAAQLYGADVREGVTVVDIAATASGYEVVSASGEKFVADGRVLLLANYQTPQILSRLFGVELPISGHNYQATAVKTKTDFTFTHLMGHQSLPFAAKTIEDGLVMLTGGRGGIWDQREESGQPRPGNAQSSVRETASIYGAFADAEVAFTDASRIETQCVDDIPVIDAVPAAPGVIFATGWSGHGFAIAPAVAELIAQWCETGQKPALLEPFHLARFDAAVKFVAPSQRVELTVG